MAKVEVRRTVTTEPVQFYVSFELFVHVTYAGRVSCESRDKDYCGSCKVMDHRAQLLDKTSWTQGRILDEWWREGIAVTLREAFKGIKVPFPGVDPMPPVEGD